MRKHTVWCGIGLACALTLGGGWVVAQDKKADDKKPQDVKAGQAPSEAEMWALVEKMGTPGPQHKALDAVIGAWETTMKSQMGPDGKPFESKGTSIHAWIMDGRFVHVEFNGTFMNKPFKGAGVTGYDNAKQKYVTAWIDTMNTGITQLEGTYDAGTKTFTYLGEMEMPPGNKMKYRQLIRILDKDKHVMEWWEPGPDGKDVKTMEIIYTRKS